MAPSEATVELPRQVKPGDLILTCKPWICTPTVGTRGYVCANCFKCHLVPGVYNSNVHPVFLKICSGCKAIGYCDEKCQKVHWKAEHKEECYFMRNIISSQFRELVFPNITTFNSRTVQHCTRKLMVLKILNKLLKNLPEPQDGPSLKTQIERFMKLEHCYPIVYQLDDKRIIQQLANPGPLGLGSEGERWARHNYEPVVYAAFGPERRKDVQKLMVKYDVERMYQILRSQQKFVIYDMTTQMMLAMAFYFEVAGAQFTCEANSFFSFAGKSLELRAMEPFIYSGSPSDIKLEYDTIGKGHMIPRDYRMIMYTRFHGRPCQCKLCSSAFDCELNCLRCANSRCDQPRPLDKRALEPCPKCGTKMAPQRLAAGQDRLWRFYFMPYYRAQFAGVEPVLGLLKMYSRVASGRDHLVHPTNYFVLRAIATAGYNTLHYEDPLWHLFMFQHMRSLIPSYRRMFPRHSNCLKFVLLVCAEGALLRNSLLTLEQKAECLVMLKEVADIERILYGGQRSYKPEEMARLEEELCRP